MIRQSPNAPASRLWSAGRGLVGVTAGAAVGAAVGKLTGADAFVYGALVGTGGAVVPVVYRGMSSALQSRRQSQTVSHGR